MQYTVSYIFEKWNACSFIAHCTFLEFQNFADIHFITWLFLPVLAKLCICQLCNFLVNYVHFLKCRVLERIGARALVAHVRTFADFLVYEFSTSAGGQQLNKCIEILNDMVWKYNIVTLDRLILCLVSPLLLVFYVHESCYMVDVSD